LAVGAEWLRTSKRIRFIASYRYNKVQLGSWGDNYANELGRPARPRPELLTLLVPNTAFASWWTGGYNRRVGSAAAESAAASDQQPNRPPAPATTGQQPPSDQPPSGGYGSEQPAPGSRRRGLRLGAARATTAARRRLLLPTAAGAELRARTAGTRTSGAAVDLRLRRTATFRGRDRCCTRRPRPPKARPSARGRHRGRDHLAGDGLDRARSPQGAGLRLHQQPVSAAAERRGAGDSNRRPLRLPLRVPAALPAGSTICDQGFVSAPTARRSTAGRSATSSVSGWAATGPAAAGRDDHNHDHGDRTADGRAGRSDSTRQCRRRPRRSAGTARAAPPGSAPYCGDSSPAALAAGALTLALLAAPVPGAGPGSAGHRFTLGRRRPGRASGRPGLAPDRDSSAVTVGAMAGVVFVNPSAARSCRPTRSRALCRHRVVECPPQEIPSRVADAVTERPDFVAVAGGDGTLRGAAPSADSTSATSTGGASSTTRVSGCPPPGPAVIDISLVGIPPATSVGYSPTLECEESTALTHHADRPTCSAPR